MRRQRILAVLGAVVLTTVLLAAGGGEAAPPESAPEAAGTPFRRVALIGDAFDLTTGATIQRLSPSVAYNSTDNQYLAVWFEHGSPGGNDIYGQRVSAAGGPVGANFPIMEFADSQSDPSVAYNSTDNQYLVAWRTQQAGSFDNARGRLISGSGALLGADFFISQAGHEISIAHNTAANEYLLTARGMFGVGLRARRVSSTGALVGSETIVTTAGPPAPNGQVVHNPDANEYFMTWRDQTANDLEAQRISASGVPLSTPIIVSPVFTRGEYAAGVAFDTTLNRYLVVFSEIGSNSIMAQFVSGSGVPFGTNFHIASGLGEPSGTPQVAYSPIERAFLIVTREGGDIVGRLLSGDGGILGPPRVIARGTVSQSRDPSLAYNSHTGDFLVAWPDDRNVSLGEQDIYARLLGIAAVGPGDANCDGSVNAIDAALVLQYTAGLIGSDICLAAAEVSRNGSLDAVDAALILQYVAGLIPDFPAP